jgi:hypothetical protein
LDRIEVRGGGRMKKETPAASGKATGANGTSEDLPYTPYLHFPQAWTAWRVGQYLNVELIRQPAQEVSP